MRLLRRLRLFLGIVWRESPAGERISIACAWAVAGIVWRDEP